MSSTKIPLTVPFMYAMILLVMMLLLAFCIKTEIRLACAALTKVNGAEGLRAVIPHNATTWYFFVKLVLVTIITISLLIGTTYVLLDVPHFFSNDLETTVGVVVEHDSAGKDDVSDSRGIIIQDTESGRRIRVLVIYTPIHQNEVYEVSYLPHTHIGYIVERLE